MSNMSEPTKVLRKHQEEDPTLGPLFKALHTFCDRTIEEFFKGEDMPYPVIAMEKDRRSRLGYYTQRDGYALVHRINLNPFGLRNGVDAAHTLAHELVHLWQAHVGRPCKRNYHGLEFHARMALYGIETRGRNGYHAGAVTGSDTWAKWMERNADLELGSYMLPGMDAKPGRQLHKHQCPKCRASFRSRRKLRVQCLTCNAPFAIVPTQAVRRQAAS